jgi:hypothetical protein
VLINDINKAPNPVVNKFNETVLGIFNVLSGNMLLKGNILSWNVYFDNPSVVDQEEWRRHAEKWREYIDVDHRSPEGDGTQSRYYDGTYLHIEVAYGILKLIKEVLIPHAQELNLDQKFLKDFADHTLNHMHDLTLAIDTPEQ